MNSIYEQIVSASPTLLLNAMLARWAQFCKDCYIISTCTPSCPATGTAWLWGLAQAGAWLCYPLRWLSIYNPNNVNSFGAIFPNLNVVFASIWAARPVHFESDQYRSCSTVKQGPAVGATPSTPIGEQPKTALWLWVREITWYLYTRWVHGRMKAKHHWFKVTREVCHEWFHNFRHHVHDGHWTGEFATVIWRLHCFTVSFRGDVRLIAPG